MMGSDNRQLAWLNSRLAVICEIIARLRVSMLVCILLAACAENSLNPYNAAGGRYPLDPCRGTEGNAVASWQCQRFYARQKIDGYCLTVSGGEFGARQCQQFYSKLAEQPAPASAPSVTRPASSPSPSAPPAAITVGKFAGRGSIYVGGAIVSDENGEFARRAAEARNPLVVLSGPGGNTLAAIRIGQFVRMRGWDTVVPEGESCMSACALAWLGGAHRYMGATSKIGFHASYRVEGGKAIESGVGNAVVGAYLNSLGLPERAVVYVTMSGPDDLQLLTFGDATVLGIRVSMLGG
jgi:hypothetical protein